MLANFDPISIRLDLIAEFGDYGVTRRSDTRFEGNALTMFDTISIQAVPILRSDLRLECWQLFGEFRSKLESVHIRGHHFAIV